MMADEAAERVARQEAEELVAKLWRERIGYVDAINLLTDALLTHAREARRLALEEAAQIADSFHLLTDALLTHAREARRLALEEAAQIADSFRDPDRDTLGYQEAENIATTIRALKEPTR